MQASPSTPLSQQIADYHVEPGSMAAWWLGGSGYLFKSPRGTVVCVDPYLSDAAERLFGMRRAEPSPLRAEDVQADIYLCTHFHEDHLDPDSAKTIADHNPDALIAMPPTARSRAAWLGIPTDRVDCLAAEQVLHRDDVTITATVARHDAGVDGWETPDAIGLVIEAPGVKIYHSGDTEYDARLRTLAKWNLTAAILCVNGTGGNMNAHEAALLAWQIGVGTLIPHHHATWATPPDTKPPNYTEDLEATYTKLGGTGRVLLPHVAQAMCISKTITAR